MTERAEVVERHARIGAQPIPLTDLAEELRFADAVDPQIPLEIRIQFDDLARIPGLLDHEADHERFQLRRRSRHPGGLRRLDSRRNGPGPVPHPVGLAAAGRQQRAQFVERARGDDRVAVPRQRLEQMLERFEHLPPGGAGTAQRQDRRMLGEEGDDDLLQTTDRLHEGCVPGDRQTQPRRRGPRGRLDGHLPIAMGTLTVRGPVARPVARPVAIAAGVAGGRERRGVGDIGRVPVVASVGSVPGGAVAAIAALTAAMPDATAVNARRRIGTARTVGRRRGGR